MQWKVQDAIALRWAYGYVQGPASCLGFGILQDHVILWFTICHCFSQEPMQTTQVARVLYPLKYMVWVGKRKKIEKYQQMMCFFLWEKIMFENIYIFDIKFIFFLFIYLIFKIFLGYFSFLSDNLIQLFKMYSTRRIRLLWEYFLIQRQ